MRRAVWISLAAGVLAAVAFWAGADQAAVGPGAATVAPPAPGRPTPAPSGETPPARRADPGDTYHGLSWQIHRSAGCVEAARVVFAEMAALGADTVLISNAGYQEHAGSDSFHLDPEVSPTEQQWMEIFELARRHGLRVILMPIILLSHPRGTEWRGVINPPSWDDWMEQYQKFILHFAALAARGRIEMMTVGSELVTAEKSVPVEQWRRLIREVRKVFPGKLSYSSNWDHYKVVQFWDELDVVGMTSYYKLASEPNPSLESLVAAWQPIKRGLLRWQKEIGKPLLFTEVGWCSQSGAAIEPWNYYHDQRATPEGLQEQLRCYQAFIETWRDQILTGRPPVGGVIWWEWPLTEGGEKDYNYTPKGKPAEQVLRAWFASVQDFRRQRTALAPAGP